MPDTKLDLMLSEFLERDQKDRASGLSMSAFHGILSTVVDGLNEHVKACDKRWEDNKSLHDSVHKRLVHLEAAENGIHAVTAPLKSDDDSAGGITGVHDMKEFANKLVEVARNSSDEDVERLVEDKQRELEDKKELKRLQTIEAQGLEDAKARKKAYALSAIGAVGGAGAVVLVEVIRWLSSFHH